MFQSVKKCLSGRRHEEKCNMIFPSNRFLFVAKPRIGNIRKISYLKDAMNKQILSQAATTASPQTSLQSKVCLLYIIFPQKLEKEKGAANRGVFDRMRSAPTSLQVMFRILSPQYRRKYQLDN